jgi:hypothetical protein
LGLIFQWLQKIGRNKKVILVQYIFDI